MMNTLLAQRIKSSIIIPYESLSTREKSIVLTISGNTLPIHNVYEFANRIFRKRENQDSEEERKEISFLSSSLVQARRREVQEWYKLGGNICCAYAHAGLEKYC